MTRVIAIVGTQSIRKFIPGMVSVTLHMPSIQLIEPSASSVKDIREARQTRLRLAWARVSGFEVGGSIVIDNVKGKVRVRDTTQVFTVLKDKDTCDCLRIQLSRIRPCGETFSYVSAAMQAKVDFSPNNKYNFLFV